MNDEHYWESRKEYRYYQVAARLAKEYGPTARTVLDVGARDTRFLELIDWVSAKTAIDVDRTPVVRGAQNLRCDFLSYEPNVRFDLVFCLQVLEHLHRPAVFLKKLLATGRLVIVSVPYDWAHDPDSDHVHDAVDEARLMIWAGKRWVHATVVEDESRERLIAVFREGDPATPSTVMEIGDSDVDTRWVRRSHRRSNQSTSAGESHGTSSRCVPRYRATIRFETRWRVVSARMRSVPSGTPSGLTSTASCAGGSSTSSYRRLFSTIT